MCCLTLDLYLLKRWKGPEPIKPWSIAKVSPVHNRACPQFLGPKFLFQQLEEQGRVGEDCLETGF